MAYSIVTPPTPIQVNDIHSGGLKILSPWGDGWVSKRTGKDLDRDAFSVSVTSSTTNRPAPQSET